MKLFRLTLGTTDLFGVAEDAEDMFNRKHELDATFAYTPVNIEEVIIPGYTIDVQPIEDDKSKRRK